MKKRILSMLLVAIMLLTLLPMTAFADSEKTVTFTVQNWAGKTGSSVVHDETVGTGDGEIGAVMRNFKPSNGQIRGSTNYISDNFYIYNTTKMPGSITGITITANTDDNNKFQNTMYAAVGTDSQSAITETIGCVSSETSDNSLSWTFDAAEGYTYFKLLSDERFTTGSVTGVVVTVTYSVSDPQKELVSISVDGTPTKTEYTVGESFDPTGLTVQATYSDASTADVTDNAEFTVVPETFAEASDSASIKVTAKVGTVTSSEKTIDNIKVKAPAASYAISNGTPQSGAEKNNGYITIDKENAAEGDTVTVTVNPADGYQLKSLTVVPTGFVDLGIKDAEGKPLYWKETNLGANNASDPGDYYMWGATALMYSAVDHSLTNGAFTFVTENPYGDNYKNTWDARLGFYWNNVPFADGVFKNNDGERNVFTKYTTIDEYAKSGTPDNITALQPEDDAATAKNENWHTPTYDEFVALAANCVLVWTSDYNSTGNAGYIVYKAKNDADKGKVNMNGTWKMWDAANSKYIANTGSEPTGYSTSDIHIFLPVAGYGNNTAIGSKNLAGCYCSSNLSDTNNHFVGAVNFAKTAFNIAYNYSRCYGFSVRPVMNFSGITPEMQTDGTYQFKMPGYAVTVKAEFEEAAEETEQELTVFGDNATQTQRNAPVYTYYGDTKGSAAQYIIPASMLTELVGKQITELKYYINPDQNYLPQSITTPTYKGYMGVASSETLSTFIDFTTATKVFEGKLSALSGANSDELVITLDTPYTYTGGNLAIAFECTKAGNYCSTYYYSKELTGGSIYRNSSAGNLITQNYVPKTTITYLGTAAPAGKTLPYSFDFETDPFSEINGWTTIDADGDGHNWETGTDSYWNSNVGIDYSHCAVSESYLNDGYQSLNTNNWLFSPAITVPAGGAKISWYEWNTAYGDAYTVYVSETNKSTDTSGMTVICAKHEPTVNIWTQKTAELSAKDYGGKTVYIAFQHQKYDGFLLAIDNFAAEALSTPHTHTPVLVNGQAATETAAGFKDYYKCDCGASFEDATGNVPITDLNAWKAAGGNGYIAPLVHSITPVNGQDATDTEAGFKAYYECKSCGKYYEDATGLVVITDINAWKAEDGNGYLAPLHGTDENHDHICDYCTRIVSNHIDTDPKDHICDICGKTISNHTDTEPKDHICDICGKAISNHIDTEPKDHVCDYCGKVLNNHADDDKDHICDYCGETISNHIDTEPKDHVCDYCGKTINNHVDENKDHICDYCGETISNHADTDNNHICDYCGKVITNHVDEDGNKDHLCDICGDVISNHEDTNKDHICDICGKAISNHADENQDHVCDYCGKTISNHEDADKNHICEYCGKVISNHNAVLVEGTAATLQSAGHKSYYKCDCGKFFEDATCKVEITDLDAWKAQGGNGYIAKLEEEPTSPQTGDNSHMALWAMLMGAAFVGLVSCGILGKKRKNER